MTAEVANEILNHPDLEKVLSLIPKNPDKKLSAKLSAEIAPSLSVDIALYRDNDSQATGFYDYESDTIYLNVASKVDLTTREGKETAMAFTLGHELLHRARVGDQKGYDSFVKFLLSEYGKAGMDVEEMIGEQIALSNAHDKTLPESKRVNMTREMAIEEIAAEACSRMLVDTNAAERLGTIKSANMLKEINTTGEGGGNVRFAVSKSFFSELQQWFDNTTHEQRK